MNKKISLLIVLGCVVCVATLMLATEVQDGSLKLRHSFGESTHKTDAGYKDGDATCTPKCDAAGGVNCGKNWQNCCVHGECDEGWFADVCDKRLPIEGCTPA